MPNKLFRLFCRPVRGFALQLLTLRYLGFCPDKLTTVPADVVAYVAKQLSTTPESLIHYGKRAQTRTDHFQKIQAYLGFRPAKLKVLRSLAKWLFERALEHDKPMLLLQLACERLYYQKIVRPGVTVLERMVITARSRDQQHIFRRLKPILTPHRQSFLDQLLVRNTSLGCTPLTWLRQNSTSNSPPAIRNALAKLAFLRQQGVPDWDISCLTPNRLKFLAQLGKKSTN